MHPLPSPHAPHRGFFHDTIDHSAMTLRTALNRSARFAVAAIAAGLLLSGCATTTSNSADSCVGPPSYCNVYFGS
jgi:hypothetical protein